MGRKTPFILAVCLLASSCGGAKKTAESAPVVPAGEVKITQFYTGASRIQAGEKSMICYGVENATAVTLQPDVEKLTPALNRCFYVSPQRSTRYTLKALGADGRTVTTSFEIEVVGRAAAPVPLPVIGKFYIKPKEGGEDKPPTLCYVVEDADAVDIAPAAMGLSPVLQGCLYVNPKTTTTYTLTAHGVAGRTVSRQLTVEVP